MKKLEGSNDQSFVCDEEVQFFFLSPRVCGHPEGLCWFYPMTPFNQCHWMLIIIEGEIIWSCTWIINQASIH